MSNPTQSTKTENNDLKNLQLNPIKTFRLNKLNKLLTEFYSHMGACIGKKNSHTKINLKHLIVRLKAAAPMEKGKLERRLSSQQSSLIEHFQKPKESRTRAIEDCLIIQTVCLSNMIHLWGVTQNCCAKILNYYTLLENQQNFVHIQKEIEVLLFLKSILNHQDLDEIYKEVIRRYKINEPVMIDNQVANYHKRSNAPDHKMKTEYIMSLCMNRQLDLQKINQVGHNFRYGY